MLTSRLVAHSILAILLVLIAAQVSAHGKGSIRHERSLPDTGSQDTGYHGLPPVMIKKREEASSLGPEDVISMKRQGKSQLKDQSENIVEKRDDSTAQKPDTPDSGGKNATGAANATVTGPVIDFMLSNWWNSTQFLAQSNPNITFTTNDTYPTSSQNSTANQTTIFGIEVKARRQYQTMVGLGGGLTDATAVILQALRASYPDAYSEILNLLFNESPEWIAKGGAGLNMLRVPIGASDFGFQEYTYDDTVDGSNDTTLSQFNIDKSPKRWQTIQDILKINPNMIIMASPWSQPAWMKGTPGNMQGSLRGGSVLEQFEDAFADYLVKFVQTMKSSKGIPIHALSLQNEPYYDKASYPCTKMEPEQQARIGVKVRQKLDAAGFNEVGLFAWDHNWDKPDYPTKVFDQAAEAFRGVAWHCYLGDPVAQRDFNDAFPEKHIWFTECTKITQFYQEPWDNIKKGFDKIIAGSVSYNSETVILWNLALQVDMDGFTVPSLPQTCNNCLAPILIFDNSTGDLQGLNRAAIDQRGPKNSKRASRLFDWKDSLSRRGGSGPKASLFRRAALSERADDDDAMRISGGLANVNPKGPMNEGAMNDGEVIPPSRSTYYRSSDFVLLAHLGQSIRPNSGGKRWAQRVGVVTTEDGNKGPRIKAQLFRNDLGNGSSRWSLIILQQLDHYGYNFNTAEDSTIKIKFRDFVASITLPPGAYTLQWTAENSKFEVNPSSPRSDGRTALADDDE